MGIFCYICILNQSKPKDMIKKIIIVAVVILLLLKFRLVGAILIAVLNLLTSIVHTIITI